MENIFFVFLSSYRNTREGLGELEKAVETLACGLCSHSISRSPKPPLVFLWLDRNTENVFYSLNVNISGQYFPEMNSEMLTRSDTNANRIPPLTQFS